MLHLRLSYIHIITYVKFRIHYPTTVYVQINGFINREKTASAESMLTGGGSMHLESPKSHSSIRNTEF